MVSFSLELVAYPLREWHYEARQLAMFASPLSLRAEQLLNSLGQLRKKFGELVVRLASTIGPPVPVPIRVRTAKDGRLISWHLGGWSRPIAGIYESWRERHSGWDEPVHRDYYQVESPDGLIFTLLCDGQGQWFLDRRRH